MDILNPKQSAFKYVWGNFYFLFFSPRVCGAEINLSWTHVATEDVEFAPFIAFSSTGHFSKLCISLFATHSLSLSTHTHPPTMLIRYHLCPNHSLMQPLITSTHFLIVFPFLCFSLLCLYSTVFIRPHPTSNQTMVFNNLFFNVFFFINRDIRQLFFFCTNASWQFSRGSFGSAKTIFSRVPSQ